MSKKVQTVFIVIFIIFLTGVAIFAIPKIKSFSSKSSGNNGRSGEKTLAITTVKTVVARSTPLIDFIVTNGEIETQKSIEVFPTIGGTVVETRISLGSAVKRGDIIAFIDPSEPGSKYARGPVTAPISGSIISTPVKVGQKVTLNSVITKIGDINNLQITAKVPERYVADLKIGQKAEISLQAYEGEVFGASVVRISPVVDPMTRTKEVILNFDKSYSQVNAGMFARVRLFTVEYSGYPTISQDAFVNEDDDYYLFVVNENNRETVQKRLVKRGKNVSGVFQILEGVEDGETVVIEGVLTLFDGAKIKDITNASESTLKKSNLKKGDKN